MYIHKRIWMLFVLRTLLRHAVFSVESSKFPESSVRFASHEAFSTDKTAFSLPRNSLTNANIWKSHHTRTRNLKIRVGIRNFLIGQRFEVVCEFTKVLGEKWARGDNILLPTQSREWSYKIKSTFLFGVSSSYARYENPCRHPEFLKSVSVSNLCARLRKFWVKSWRWGTILKFSSVKKNCWIGVWFCRKTYWFDVVDYLIIF